MEKDDNNVKCACGEKTEQLLNCSRCYTSYCDRCNPYFDEEQNVCQQCQEKEQIQKLSEDGFTGKLRVWFNEPALEIVKPKFLHPLPWYADGELRLDLESDRGYVAKFRNRDETFFAAKACSQHHQLKTALAKIYNRIRTGDAWFDGSEEDVRMWQEVKRLLDE